MRGYIKMDKLYKIDDYELLNQKVYRILKLRIVKGDIEPGSKLLEKNISEKLGVSRTPVREAIQKLAAEGFIKMIPNQGMVVSKISIKGMRELLQIRSVLEGLAARLVAQVIKEEEIKELEKYQKQMEFFTNENNPLAFSEMDDRFHKLILNISGNSRLIQIRENLSYQNKRYRIKSLSVPGRLKYALKEHQEIVEALKRKDSKQADRLSQKHIENGLKNILAHEKKDE